MIGLGILDESLLIALIIGIAKLLLKPSATAVFRMVGKRLVNFDALFRFGGSRSGGEPGVLE